MQSHSENLDTTMDQKIEKIKLKRKIKKKTSGWRESKLDCVSDDLVALRRKGQSLSFMVDFVFDYRAISVHKSTVKRYLDKLEFLAKEKHHEEKK